MSLSDSDDEIIMSFLKENNDEQDFEILHFMESTEMNKVLTAATCARISHGIRQNHIRPKLYCEAVVPQMSDEDFYKLYRMTRQTFTNLILELKSINTSFERAYVGGNDVLSAEKKVLVTLTYLGTQMSYLRIAELFNIAKSSANIIVHECVLLILQLSKKYIKWPTRNESDIIANKFQMIANFPDTIGAIDGSHINVKPPVDQQDSYTNRKMQKSIILQAVCTSDKLFTNIFVGFPGSAHDARVLTNSNLYKTVEEEGGLESMFYGKYHIIGDSAYPLRDWLITPFRNRNLTPPESRFNTVLSKTRCVIENSFGLLKGRWRRLLFIDVNDISFASDIVLACCTLQNFCLLSNDYFDEMIDDETQDEQPIPRFENIPSGNTKRINILRNM